MFLSKNYTSFTHLLIFLYLYHLIPVFNISSRYPIRTRTGAYLLHHMESIFARLLIPDNETIRQVTTLVIVRQ